MIETHVLKPTGAALDKAAATLADGALVAFPTETVYGLGGDATSDAAVAKIFEAKARPGFNPLISHVADPGAAFMLGDFDERARAVAEAFWPGPMTLVVRRRDNCPISLLASAGLDTLAIRVPAHPLATRRNTLLSRPALNGVAGECSRGERHPVTPGAFSVLRSWTKSYRDFRTHGGADLVCTTRPKRLRPC